MSEIIRFRSIMTRAEKYAGNRGAEVTAVHVVLAFAEDIHDSAPEASTIRGLTFEAAPLRRKSWLQRSRHSPSLQRAIELVSASGVVSIAAVLQELLRGGDLAEIDQAVSSSGGNLGKWLAGYVPR